MRDEPPDTEYITLPAATWEQVANRLPGKCDALDARLRCGVEVAAGWDEPLTVSLAWFDALLVRGIIQEEGLSD